MATAAKEDLIPEAFREVVLRRPLNANDLRILPEDRNRYEIIGGQLFVSPSPSTRHQAILGELLTALKIHLTSTGTGSVFSAPLDVHLSFNDVVQPDLFVVLTGRQGIIREHGMVGAPNLVIEILSPSSSVTDRVDKAALYARNKVEEYWIVDPMSETVTVHLLYDDHFPPPAELTRADDLYSRVLPGFVLDLDELFGI